eukprot:TRINITY_DN5246_c0_g1_i5.p1 TRINITY_DN5246_c0_g1~~TRINITY_DN5246_c0_g1_i5.p1  ORF type:complete len:1080 (+),score=180.60 TRINITY_DN5246_c0_g1_i5:45-3284(+)
MKMRSGSTSSGGGRTNHEAKRDRARSYKETATVSVERAPRNSWIVNDRGTYDESFASDSLSTNASSVNSNRNTKESAPYSSIKKSTQDFDSNFIEDGMVSSDFTSDNSEIDEAIKFEDLQGAVEALSMDKDQDLFIHPYTLEFSDEKMNREFMEDRALKKKKDISRLMMIAGLIAFILTIQYLFAGSIVMAALAAMGTLCCVSLILFIRRSPNYARFYAKAVNTFFIISSVVTILSRIAAGNNYPSIINITLNMVFMTWFRGRFQTSVRIAGFVWVLFLFASLTYMTANDIFRAAVPFALSTCGQILVAYNLEKNDRRFFRGQKLAEDYKRQIFQKESKTNELLRKIYPSFVADNLRSALTIESMSQSFEQVVLIHIRFTPNTNEKATDEEWTKIFESAKAFQQTVDKLCRRVSKGRVCKVKFCGETALIVCGFSGIPTSEDLSKTVDITDKLKLYAHGRVARLGGRFAAVVTTGEVDCGIVVCQKQSYDVFGPAVSASLALLDNIWRTAEPKSSRVFVSESIQRIVDGEYEPFCLVDCAMKQIMYQYSPKKKHAKENPNHESKIVFELPHEVGNQNVHPKTQEDVESVSAKSMSTESDASRRGLCLLPGEDARHQEAFQNINDRESQKHQLKIATISLPYLWMMVLWSIFWGTIEQLELNSKDAEYSNQGFGLTIIRFFVTIPSLSMALICCKFVVGSLELQSNVDGLHKVVLLIRLMVVAQGMLLAFKVAAFLDLSAKGYQFQPEDHSFFRNELLLWSYISTTISVTTKRFVWIATISWALFLSISFVSFQRETGFLTMTQLLFYLSQSVFLLAVLNWFQGRTSLGLKALDLQSRIEIEKEIYRSNVEQRIAERIVLSVLPVSLYSQLSSGTFTNKVQVVEAVIIVVNFSRYSSSTKGLSAEQKVTVLSELFSFLEHFASRYNVVPLKTFADRYTFWQDSTCTDGGFAQGLRFAMDLQSLCKYGFPLPHEIACHLKIGISYGRCVGGVVDTNGFSYDLYGDCASSANLLSRICPANLVLVDERARDLFSDCREYLLSEYRWSKSNQHPKCFVAEESEDIWARFMSHIDWMTDEQSTP